MRRVVMPVIEPFFKPKRCRATRFILDWRKLKQDGAHALRHGNAHGRAVQTSG